MLGPQALSEEHVRWCAEWPSRPATSYIQHYANKDGIHYSRDGHKEKGWNVPWDSYNPEPAPNPIAGCKLYPKADQIGQFEPPAPQIV